MLNITKHLETVIPNCLIICSQISSEPNSILQWNFSELSPQCSWNCYRTTVKHDLIRANFKMLDEYIFIDIYCC